jgi:hypothetical protein
MILKKIKNHLDIISLFLISILLFWGLVKFTTTVSFLLKKSKNVDSKLRGNKLLWGIFYLHTISGFIYLIKFFIVGNGA